LKLPKIDFSQIILFENDSFLIVNKPPFLSTLEDRQDPLNLLALARNYVPTAQVCHRLDKETSGALTIAKSPEAYRHLSIQFENRQVN
jgi:23S rRNA pseudouridine955/2504/2580 synthase